MPPTEPGLEVIDNPTLTAAEAARRTTDPTAALRTALDGLLPYLMDKPGCPARNGTGPCICGRNEATDAVVRAASQADDPAWNAEAPDPLTYSEEYRRGWYAARKLASQADDPSGCEACARGDRSAHGQHRPTTRAGR